MTSKTIRLVFLACCAFLIAAALSVRAQAQTPVSLELVLMADATGSIDNDEIRFQREGYATAITDPAVIDAIIHSGHGKIALTYVEWADFLSQDIVVPWMVIDGAESAKAFAEALLVPPRRAYGRNAIGAALLAGKQLIETNEYKGVRSVIDLSADSANNWNGPGILEARAEVVAAGITINGLAVLCRSCSGQPISYDLETAFRERIIGGPGAFVVTAENSQNFAAAVRRKLILEIVDERQGLPYPSFAYNPSTPKANQSSLITHP